MPPRDNPETVGQILPYFTEPKGIDRFREASRVGTDYATQMRNLMLDDGVLTSRLGTDLMGGNAASKVMQVVDLVRKGQKKVTVRFCLRHLELFEYGLGAWRSFSIPLTGSERDFFAYTGWADKLLFSNGVDGLWEFDFKTLEAKIVPGAPGAKSLTTFGGRVVAGYTIEKGDEFPLRVRWTVKNNYLKWNSDTDIGAGYEDLYGGLGGVTDEVTGIVPYSDTQAWLVRSRSVYQMSVSGNVAAPYRFDITLDKIGSPFRQTVESLPAGVIFASRDNVHLLTNSGHEQIGDLVIDEISEEAGNLRFASAAYDVGRHEYRLASGTLVWRYNLRHKAWTTDEYPFPIRSLSRQIQGVAGIPIDNLPGTIDELPSYFPPGAINDLVYDRGFDDAMMFVPLSTELTVRETDDPRDTLLTGEETDSALVLVTGVMNLDVLKAAELLEIHGEFLSEMDQQLVFELSFDNGSSWVPLSLKDITETAGSELFFVKSERVGRHMQLRVRSTTLGKLRLLGIAPVLRSVSRSMAPKRPKPATIVVLPNQLSLVVGGTQSLSWQVLGAGGQVITGLAVTFLSTNSNIATVNSLGVVRAIGAGSFAIVATLRNIQVSIQGTVAAATPAAVATVTITPSVSQGATGTQQQFTATLRDINGNILLGRTVVWSSSTPAFAMISSTGLVTLVAAGTTTISATSEGVTSGSALTVTASPAVVATVGVTPATFAGDVGETVQLVATPRDAGANALSGKVITWASSAPAIATVNATGLVTLVGAGSVTITATCETVDGTSAGTVTAAEVPVSTVTVAPGSFSITAGATQALTATTRDVLGNILTGRVVTWASSNTSIATVNGSGLVTGVAGGSATITATSEGKSGTSTATITAVPVATVSINPAVFAINPGQSTTLVATTRDAANNVLLGRTVVWGSSDPTKATVSSAGVVTAIATGAVTITATSETKVGSSAGTIGAATFSPVNSNSGVKYVPEPHPAGVVAALPTVFFETSYGKRCKTGATVTFASTETLVNSGNATQNSNSLQAAINAAASRAGNSKIILPNPFPWNDVACREHTAGDYVTYIEAQTLPSAEFVQADTAAMTNAPKGTTSVLAHCIQFDRRARGYRFVGLRFGAVPKTQTSVIYHIIPVFPKESSIEYDTVLADKVEDVVFDRCWFEGNDAGTGTDTGNVRDGVMLNGSYIGLVNSVVNKIGSTGNESHGVLITNAPGPTKLVENWIEATSINIFIGGDMPHYGAVEGRPRQIEVRRNLVNKRLQWAKDDAAWDGVPGRGIKNLIETKNCDGVLFEGNILDGNWADAQSGMAFIIKSGIGSGTAPGNGSENVTFRHNIIRNSVRCWNFAALPDEQDAIPSKLAAIYNNLAYDIGNYAGQNVESLAYLILQSFHDLYFAHNTTVHNNTPNAMQFAYAGFPDGKAQRFIFKDNIGEMAYIWSDGNIGTVGLQNWAEVGYVWERNVFVLDGGLVGSHPGGTNQYPATRAAIGFVNLAGDNYRLDAGSPYKGDGEGGSDPGADVDKVELATSGVA